MRTYSFLKIILLYFVVIMTDITVRRDGGALHHPQMIWRTIACPPDELRLAVVASPLPNQHKKLGKQYILLQSKVVWMVSAVVVSYNVC